MLLLLLLTILCRACTSMISPTSPTSILKSWVSPFPLARELRLTIGRTMLPGPLLRLLSSRAIFREVSPDVFANNRMSSALDTGKTLQEIQLECACRASVFVLSNQTRMPSPIEKYNGSNGMAALFATTCVIVCQDDTQPC